jgi:TolB-like protein/DNA-binding winged helix-turn-helix (wHTH) protein/Flp pilus assembly protein TadD
MNSQRTQATAKLQSDSSDIDVGGCTARPSQNLIECGGHSTKISPRAMDMLVYLAERPGEVVSGDELIDAIWHGRVINDAQIYKTVSLLRRTFSDLNGGAPFIQTVPKRGYRLVAPVTPAGSSASIPFTSIHRMWPRGKLGYVTSGVLLLIVAGGSIEGAKRLWGAATPRASEDLATIAAESLPAMFTGPLAVLPFDNLSPNADDVYFAAGIHEEILNQLRNITDLRVISQSSVLPYASENRAASEVAAELDAGAVLVGSVRYADKRVRIYTQLIDAVSGSQVWSASYERDLEDIFAVQTEIAINVATALETQLNLADRLPLNQHFTDSPKAYTLYLRAGKTALTPGLPNAIRHLYLDQALELDPDFAQAHARKADVHALELVSNFSAGAAGRPDLDKADRLTQFHAEKALALRPDNGQAFIALGRLHQYRWRWADAQLAYEQAFTLDPGDLDLLRAYAQFSAHSGNHAKAISLANRGTELAPNQPGMRFRLGSVQLHAGNLDAATAAFRKAIELDPSHAIAHVYFAIMQGIQGDGEDALTELHVAEQLLSNNPLLHLNALLAYGYSRVGRQEDAARIVRQIEELATHSPLGTGSEIFIALALGDQERALECLQGAAESINNQTPDVSYHNLMLAEANVFADSTLNEPRFRAVRGEINNML